MNDRQKPTPYGRMLCLATALFLLVISSARAATPVRRETANERLAAIEREAGGRLGVAALDTATGRILQYRADERFPFCSTFKVMLSAAILSRSSTDSTLLQRRIAYSRDELAAYSPITKGHVGAGMTVSELCAATLQYSDNTAANLLTGLLGGPSIVTAFARSIGDEQFRLDRMEPEVNTAIPGDLRDTTTPAAMVQSLRQLTLGKALDRPKRQQLVEWMRGNTTGKSRIQAGLPAGWAIADKTGTGDYGTTNDVAVVWPPNQAPMVLVVFFTQPDPHAPARNDVVAAASRTVTTLLGQNPPGARH